MGGTKRDRPAAGRPYRLTPKGLAALRASAARVRPWLKTTGPATAEGKRRVSRNALRHGLYSADAVAARREAAWVMRLTRHQERAAAAQGPPPASPKPLAAGRGWSRAFGG